MDNILHQSVAYPIICELFIDPRWCEADFVRPQFAGLFKGNPKNPFLVLHKGSTWRLPFRMENRIGHSLPVFNFSHF